MGPRGGLERCTAGTHQLCDGVAYDLAMSLFHLLDRGDVESSASFGLGPEARRSPHRLASGMGVPMAHSPWTRVSAGARKERAAAGSTAPAACMRRQGHDGDDPDRKGIRRQLLCDESWTGGRQGVGQTFRIRAGPFLSRLSGLTGLWSLAASSPRPSTGGGLFIEIARIPGGMRTIR